MKICFYIYMKTTENIFNSKNAEIVKMSLKIKPNTKTDC